MIQSDLRRAINQPLYQPGWLHDAFIYVFMFPASVIVRAFRPEPSKFFVLPVFIFTLLLWGCIWAEPFRRRYGWQPWRFTTRDLLIIITIVAALLGLFAWLH